MACPLVSVVTITYQQQDFIREALDSILGQVTSFPYEVIVADDCSTDGTPAILDSYAKSYPDTVRVFHRPRNLGPARNFVQALRSCRGRYVALLEGDDYWCSPDKLEKQVTALAARPDVSICCSRARVIYEDDARDPWEYPIRENTVFTLEDLLRENIVPTCSTVFRLGLLLEIPDWFYELHLADWALHALLCRYGDILLLPETLAVYRVHRGGIWSGNQMRANNSRAEFYDVLGSYLPPEYRRVIDQAKSTAASNVVR